MIHAINALTHYAARKNIFEEDVYRDLQKWKRRASP